MREGEEMPEHSKDASSGMARRRARAVRAPGAEERARPFVPSWVLVLAAAALLWIAGAGGTAVAPHPRATAAAGCSGQWHVGGPAPGSITVRIEATGGSAQRAACALRTGPGGRAVLVHAGGVAALVHTSALGARWARVPAGGWWQVPVAPDRALSVRPDGLGALTMTVAAEGR